MEAARELTFYDPRPETESYSVEGPTAAEPASEPRVRTSTRAALASPSATVFATVQERESAIADLSGVLVVRVTLTRRDRHNLSAAIRRAVDECLQRVGLAEARGGKRRNPSWQMLSELVQDAAQSQILIALDGLSLLANSEGRLEGEDSLTLRELLGSPLRLILDEEDRTLQLFGPPTTLSALTGERGLVPPPASHLAMGGTLEAMIEQLEPSPTFTAAVQVTVTAEVEAAAPVEETDADVEEEAEPLRPSRIGLRAAMAGVFAEPEEAPRTVSDSGWRSHALALESARGPQSLASLEQLFVREYLPLAEHLMRDPDARQAESRARKSFEEFRHNFARVYTDAAQAFAARSKRPKMVLDAWQLAQKAARAHDARPVLLLVDGLRFDVGNRMNHILRGSFECALEEMLCAALPATTARQLELLSRGPEGLAMEHEPPSLEDVMRERTADNVRRIRAGSRDLFKLDVVETRLRGQIAPSDIEDAAEHAAHAVARFIGELDTKKRHLVYVFGDHGFPFGGSSLDQKGAFPEQVFVPAAAYLTPLEIHGRPDGVGVGHGDHD